MSLHQPTRRMLAALAFVVVLALAAIFSASGFLLAEAIQMEVAKRQAQLALLRAQISRIDRTRNDDVAAAGDHMRLVLPAMSTGAAGADLQRRLMKMVADAKGRVVSVRVLPQEAEEGLQKIMIDMAFESNIAATRDILLEMERAIPLAFVEQLNVSRLTSLRMVEGQAKTATEPLLAVTLKVSNYMNADTIANGQ
ncbi:MAG: type II secretion system protein GspM [Hyphomicrobiaceae bacterium]